MKKFILLPILLLAAMISVNGKTAPTPASGTDSMYVFRFVAGDDMFYIPWQGNDEKLHALYRVVDAHRTAIDDGSLPVQVDAYCASLPTAKENLNTAFTRANRVKSELILRKGLKEANFVTANYAHAYHNQKDVVVVTLRIPVAKEEAQTVAEQPRKDEQPVVTQPQPEPKKEEAQPVQTAQTEIATPAAPAKPYCFAVRTNLLYDAFLLPTLGIEWRINESVGIKLDGSLSWWGTEHGKVQKIWLLNPEARWYLLRDKRFYLGLAGNYGECNIYEYPIGNLLRDDTGYLGKFWNAGITLGYQLPLSRHFALDFNLGLGYSHSDYDSFGIDRGVRVFKGRDRSKSIWGPTQAGINFVWTIGK